MADVAEAVMSSYFRAWKAKDFATLRSLLADDVDFVGPLGASQDTDTYARGIEGMSAVITDVVVYKMFVDGPDVLTWFELHTSVAAAPLPTANWSRVQNGKIHRVLQVTFDPRPLTSAQEH